MYRIHGIDIAECVGECGIYKTQGVIMDYALLDPAVLINTVNAMPRAKAITAIEALRDMAAHQLEHGRPPTMGEPILRQTPAPTPFSEARQGIEGTLKFMDALLRGLRGE